MAEASATTARPTIARFGSPATPNALFLSVPLTQFTPAIPPSPGNPDPYQPGWDPLAHGRPPLPVTFTVGFTSVYFSVGGVDLSTALTQFTYTERAKGTSTGTAEFSQVSGLVNLSTLTLGAPFVCTVFWGDRFRTYTGYLLSVKESRRSGGSEWSLELGGAIALRESRVGTQVPLYCGPDPATSAAAARLLLRGTELEGLPLPTGVPLLTPPQTYDNQNLSGALNELYQPAGLWVRDAGLSAAVEAPGANGGVFPITQVLSQEPYRGSAKTYRKYRVKAEFTDLQPYAFRTVTHTVKSTSTLRKLWDQGGETETTYTTQYWGSGVVYRTEEVKGWYLSSPYTGGTSNDPCTPTPAMAGFLTWGTVSVSTERSTYTLHSSGVYVVTGTKTTQVSRSTKDEGGTLTSPNTNQSVKEKTYTLAPIQVRGVCSKNWDLYVTQYVEREYGYITPVDTTTPVWLLKSLTTETSTYNPGSLPSGDNWATGGIQWQQSVRVGRVNDRGVMVFEPTVVTQEPGRSPEYLRPVSVTRSLGTFTLGSGLEDSELIQVPHAYTLSDLQTAAQLGLLESEGAARGAIVVAPLLGSPPPNSTISLSGVRYWVDAATVNVDYTGASVTLDLGRF